MSDAVLIRDAALTDAAALAAIYGHSVLHGLGTFEEIPPGAVEMARRFLEVQTFKLPYLVAESRGQVLGFAYAAPFRARSAYRYTVEDSIYLAPEAIGRGVGKALLLEVIKRCEDMGVRQMTAVIGDSGNAASIGLHESLGFKQTGASHSVGYKHGRWVDIVFMQRQLNGGDATPPSGDGLDA